MKNRKAFTVVELVIVIAIIAVLAAVLIPTFATLIKKANVSKDTQLIRNLNTALATDNAENGGKGHRNMTEALEAAEKFGYDVDKINASETDNKILWDQVNDVFCYVDGSELKYIPDSAENPLTSISDYRLWEIYNAKNPVPTTNLTHSIYLGEGADLPPTVNVGVDVGKHNDISSINYTNTDDKKDDVVIRTNGGSLTINAGKDTVNHFGDADSVNIIDIASASYHENGKVIVIQISSGRIELEATADVTGIHINTKVMSIDEDGTVHYSDSIFDSDIILSLGDKEVTLTRDSIGIEIGDSLLLVCKVETNDGSEYIWLKGDGTIENAQVYVSTDVSGTDAVAVTPSNASNAAKAIANIYSSGQAVDVGVNVATNENEEIWATYESQAKLEYLINKTAFINLKQVANISEMTTVEIPAGRTVVIDMNSYTIDAALESDGRHFYAFENYGELTLQDLSTNKTSFIKARGVMNTGGKMTINSGKYYNIDTNAGAAVWNENYRTPADDRGYWHIKPEYLEALVAKYGEGEREFFEDVCEEFDNNYIYVTSGYGVNAGTMGTASLYYKYEKEEKQADLTINGGEFIVEYVGPVQNGGPGAINSQPGTKLTLNGGNVNSACQGCYAVNASGETVINDVTVYGAKGALGISEGTCIVNGGSFTSNLYYGCWITNDGTDTKVTINGGSFSGAYGLYSSVDDGGQDESNVAITINGGSFEGTNGSAVINKKATENHFALLIYGGRFSSNPSSYVSSSYSITESDGWFVVTK